MWRSRTSLLSELSGPPLGSPLGSSPVRGVCVSGPDRSVDAPTCLGSRPSPPPTPPYLLSETFFVQCPSIESVCEVYFRSSAPLSPVRNGGYVATLDSRLYNTFFPRNLGSINKNKIFFSLSLPFIVVSSFLPGALRLFPVYYSRPWN